MYSLKSLQGWKSSKIFNAYHIIGASLHATQVVAYCCQVTHMRTWKTLAKGKR